MSRIPKKDLARLKGPEGKKAIRQMAAKAMELGWSPNAPAADAKQAMNEPEFVYVKMGEIWGPWKRKGGLGNDGGFILRWGAKGVGFGELTFSFKAGKMVCSTECMGQKFVQAALRHFFTTSVEYKD